MKKILLVSVALLSTSAAPALLAANENDAAPVRAASDRPVEQTLSAIQRQLAELKFIIQQMTANLTGKQDQGREMNTMMQHCEGMMGQMMGQHHGPDK